MLTINADDWGGWTSATDAAHRVASAGRITAASAMVFMADSERAAELARETNLRIGLHFNLTQPFDDPRCPDDVRGHLLRVRRFLKSSKFALLVFNPFICGAVRALYAAQSAEFSRLYGRPPTHVDGHQHMHLCANALLQRVIPPGTRVRRSFTFSRGEKSGLNRAYRRWVDRRLAQSYPLTDCFFALSQCLSDGKIERVIEMSKTRQVELMTHPEKRGEYEFLMSDRFSTLLTPTSRCA